MSSIHPIIRFVAYFPNDNGRGQEELAQVAGRVGALDLTTLRQEGYLLTAQGATPLASDINDATLLDVFRGSALSSRIQSANFHGTASRADIHCKAEDSTQSYNLIQASDTEFTLESDPLGLKPVYKARTEHGEVLASRIADLLFLFPMLAEPADNIALYEIMMFWSPLAGRTLHQRIRCTLPGGRYHWVRGKRIASSRHRDYQPTEVDPYRLTDRTLEAIHECSTQALLAKTRGMPQPALLALSGGFDSRVIAALCCDHKIGIRPVTFANNHHEEWHSAQASARALGLTPERLHYPSDTILRHLPTILETVEATADPAAASIMPLLDIPSAPGSPLLHGFPHDVFTGSHMSRFSSTDNDSRESMSDAILRHYFVTSRPEMRRVFEPEIDLDEVRNDLLAGMRNDCPMYMAYHIWYLENRNRRYVGSQFALLGEHFDVVSPFYDRKLMDVWHSVPPVALKDRALFRVLIRKYYPALATIPHPDEPVPIAPNLRAQLKRWGRQLPQSILAAAIGPGQARKIALRLNRNPDILTLSKLAAPHQQAYMQARIGALEPALRENLGVKLSPEYASLLPTHTGALRSMFLAAEYAQHRADKGSGLR